MDTRRLIEMHREMVSQFCEIRARYIQMCEALLEAENILLRMIKEVETDDSTLKS